MNQPLRHPNALGSSPSTSTRCSIRPDGHGILTATMLVIAMCVHILSHTSLKQSWLMKWFVRFPSSFNCTRHTQCLCMWWECFIHGAPPWSFRKVTMIHDDSLWSTWSILINDHVIIILISCSSPTSLPPPPQSLGCISLKRRPAVEGWLDMFPTAPV